MPPAPPPPPPPPPPAVKTVLALPPAPKPPIVAPNGPNGSFLVELVIFNGAPFKDHWVYFVRSHIGSHIGVLIHATGDVRKGFEFEVKRSHNFLVTLTKPTTRIPLQWVDGKYFDEIAMFNNGSLKLDYAPCSGFEASAYKVKAPEKTLNAVDDTVSLQLNPLCREKLHLAVPVSRRCLRGFIHSSPCDILSPRFIS